MGNFAPMNFRIRVNRAATFTGHTGSVYALESFGSTTFFSGGSDRVVAEWDLERPGEGQLLARIPEMIYTLFADVSSGRLLVGQAGGGIHVIHVSGRTEERLLQYHQAPVFAIGASPVHKLLFSLSGDGVMGVISDTDLSLLTRLTLSAGKLRTVAVNNDETLVAVGAADGCVTVLSLPDLQPVAKWQAHREGFSVNAVQFSPDGKILFSGSRDAHLNSFDVENNFRLLKSIPAHNYAIYAIAFNPDHSLMATASRDKTIKIWDPESMDVLYRIDKEKNEGHKNSVNRIMWHNSGHLVSTGDDRTIMLWNLEMTGDK